MAEQHAALAGFVLYTQGTCCRPLRTCQVIHERRRVQDQIRATGGVLRDALIPRQTAEGVRAVFAPKAAGAAALLAGLGCAPLSGSALLFSSAAAFIGSPGQANYAAANAVLDAMASRMQAAGCSGGLHPIKPP